MDRFGAVTKDRAKRSYDVFVHLPVEFEMRADGHRPVSESYRHVCDRLLTEVLDELEIPCHVVGGSVARRVTQIVELLALPVEVEIDDAVALAHERIERSREMTAERRIAGQAPPTLRRRVRAAIHY